MRRCASEHRRIALHQPLWMITVVCRVRWVTDGSFAFIDVVYSRFDKTDFAYIAKYDDTHAQRVNERSTGSARWSTPRTRNLPCRCFPASARLVVRACVGLCQPIDAGMRPSLHSFRRSLGENHVVRTLVLFACLHRHCGARWQPDRNGDCVAQRFLFITATRAPAGSGVADSCGRGGMLHELRGHSQACDSQARKEIPAA